MPHADLDGRRVFYEEHGSGDPVLLVSGLGADHTAWALQTENLQEAFRVVVFDNPGVGQTEGPGGPYTTALFADVAVSLLRHLEIERQVAESPHPQTVDAFCDQAEACLTHVALDKVAEIEIPTLITVGDADILTPPAHARALHERVRGSVLHIWPEIGHAPFWEIPEAFNRLNREFLEAH